MGMNVGKEVAAMQRMMVAELRGKYAEVFGEETRSRHKQHLIRRIAWCLQANAEGGLPERARKRAAELAADSDVRLTAPPKTAPAASCKRRCGPAGRRSTARSTWSVSRRSGPCRTSG